MRETIVLFHSGLGRRPALHTFAQALRNGGHTVHIPDLFDGQVFDDFEEGVRYRDSVGIPELVERARRSVDELPEDLVYAGFSMGTAQAARSMIGRVTQFLDRLE